MNFVLILPSFLGIDKKRRKTLKPRRIRPISPKIYCQKKKTTKKYCPKILTIIILHNPNTPSLHPPTNIPWPIFASQTNLWEEKNSLARKKIDDDDFLKKKLLQAHSFKCIYFVNCLHCHIRGVVESLVRGTFQK